MGIIWPLGLRPPASNQRMRRSSTDESPYRRRPSLEEPPYNRGPSLDSRGTPLSYSREPEHQRSPFSFGFRLASAPEKEPPGSEKDPPRPQSPQPGPEKDAASVPGTEKAPDSNQTDSGSAPKPEKAPLGPQKAPEAPAGRKYVVFYLDLSFLFLIELRRCRMAEGYMRALRCGMATFNLLFWLAGCGIMGVGVWLSITQGSFATLSSSMPSLSAANLLIGCGFIAMVIGCLGCIGAVRENRILLMSFFVLLLLIFLLEMIFIILFFAYQDQIDELAQADLKEGLHLFGSEGNIGLTNAWSIVQTDFRCCGVNNQTDWFIVFNSSRVPDSCCLEYTLDCGMNDPGTWWSAPCYERVKAWLQENLPAIWIFALCTALTQILGLVFSMTIFCNTVKVDTFFA